MMDKTVKEERKMLGKSWVALKPITRNRQRWLAGIAYMLCSIKKLMVTINKGGNQKLKVSSVKGFAFSYQSSFE